MSESGIVHITITQVPDIPGLVPEGVDRVLSDLLDILIAANPNEVICCTEPTVQRIIVNDKYTYIPSAALLRCLADCIDRVANK